jgi:small-conductance mechanosensitive channel
MTYRASLTAIFASRAGCRARVLSGTNLVGDETPQPRRSGAESPLRLRSKKLEGRALARIGTMRNASWMLTLGLALALAGTSSVLGQDSNSGGAGSPAPAANSEARLAPVVLDGETLFSIRGVTARPADRRAREIADRIRALAADPKLSATSLELEEHPGATWILAHGQRLMALLDEDAAIEETTRRPLAELYRVRITEAVEAWRHERQSRVLWLNILHALGATIALLAAGYLGRRIFLRARAAMERQYRLRIHTIEDRAFQIVKGDQIWRTLAALLNVFWNAGVVIAGYFYLNYVLALFPWTRGLAKSLFAIAIDPVRTLGLGLIGLIPNVAFLTVLILVTRYALKALRLFFEGVAGETVKLKGFDPEWAWPTLRLIRMLVVVFAIVVAYPYIPGSRSEAFKGVTLFMGVIVSLGSSSIIGNLIAGYSMTYRRAFHVGDRVRIGQHIGDVERMRLLVTHLRTPKNEELVVPNSTILGAEIVNYSSMAKERGLILHTTVGIGYETPWRQVEAMLLEAAARTPGVLRQPEPFVLQTALGDFCVTYEINAYCDSPGKMEEHYTELHRHILDLFNEYGVQIMTPAYERDPSEPKIVPREQWYAAPARPPERPEQTQPASNTLSAR